MTRARLFPCVALSLSCLAAAACAINPATGKRELMLVSESQEIRLGRENDRTITAQMGLYDDEGLQAYVQALGKTLASRSERPNLEWTFRVLDDPVVNAFALPGGYVYITRGILAHMNNEAELASVVGHEIGHVTARHSASQISKAQLAQLGLGVGTIVAPEKAEEFGQLAATGLGLLFLKYGRDDERQADELGMRYMITAGYDPRPMADMFTMLDRVSAAASGDRGVPTWMSTHPAPGNRRARAESRIAGMSRDFDGWTVHRDEFLAKIDGISFGEDPRNGYFDGERFFHPAMRFRMEFPEGWKTENQPQAVVAVNQEEDAIVRLALSGQESPEAASQEFFAVAGMRRTGPVMGSISGLPTVGDGFVFETDQGNLQGRVAFVAYGEHVFALLGYTSQYRWSAEESTIRRSLASFDRLTDPRALAVEPKRLKIVRADASMSLADFASRHAASVPVDVLALINRLEPGARVEAGSPYKVVTGGELP